MEERYQEANSCLILNSYSHLKLFLVQIRQTANSVGCREVVKEWHQKSDRDIEFISRIVSLSFFFLFSSLYCKRYCLSLSRQTGEGQKKTHKEPLKWLSKMLIASKNLLKIRSIFNEDCFYKCLSVNIERYLGSFSWVFDQKFIFQK